MNPILLTSNSEHWLTPPDFSDTVVSCMDAIDLDIFSNSGSIVPAANANYYDLGQDAFDVPWIGRCFANPPYGGKIEACVAEMARRAGKMRTCELIALLPARVDTDWCQRHVMRTADAWLLWQGRVTFWELRLLVDDKGKPRPMPASHIPHPRFADYSVGPQLDKHGRPMPAPFPSLVPYWGPHVDRFLRAYLGRGTIIVPRGRLCGAWDRTREPELAARLALPA